MIIKTNMSFKTLARYAAMMWNNGEDIYMPNGDNLVEIIADSDEYRDGTFVLDCGFLISDCEWQIEKQESMLEEDEAGACHEWYLDGDRDERTMKGMVIWRKERKRLAAWKRQFAAWQKSVEEVPVWEYDSDKIDFIDYKGADGKATPKKVARKEMIMITRNVNAGIESFDQWCSYKNRIAALAAYGDRVEDSRQVRGEEHKYEVWLKDGWLFAGAGYDCEDRRYESFYTVREMVKFVKEAKKVEE